MPLVFSVSLSCAQVWVYPVHTDPHVQVSPYYTYQVGGQPSHAYYTWARGKYHANTNRDGYQRLASVEPGAYWDGTNYVGVIWDTSRGYGANAPKGNNQTYTAFSMGSGLVEVRITLTDAVLSAIGGTLNSCGVLPLAANANSYVEGNSMVVTVNKPMKIVVIPNYDEAITYYTNWGAGYTPKKIAEVLADKKAHYNEICKGFDLDYGGFKYPAFVFARGPETNVPNRNASTTLVVQPGRRYTNSEIAGYQTIWFEPGYHDWLDQSAPDPHTPVRSNQTFYFAGGSYVVGTFAGSNNQGKVIGRGNIHAPKSLENVELVQGVNILERRGHAVKKALSVIDVTCPGAWHGNTGGIDNEFGKVGLIEDCYFHSGDDATHITRLQTIRKCVFWHNTNGHPLMIQMNRENPFDNILVEDCAVIFDRKWPTYEAQLGEVQLNMHPTICATKGANTTVQAFTYRNISLDMPYCKLPLTVKSPDTRLLDYPSWYRNTTDTNYCKFRNITLENISVNSVLIHSVSQIMTDYADGIIGVDIVDYKVQGDYVTEENAGDYFEDFLNVQDLTIYDYSSPVTHYGFEGDASDSAGDNHGRIYGASFVPGQVELVKR